MKEEKDRAARAGFDGFITKPVRRFDIITALTGFIKHSIVSPEMQRPKTVATGDLAALSPEAAEKLPDAVARLKNEFMDNWQNARKKGFFNDIADFGDQIN